MALYYVRYFGKQLKDPPGPGKLEVLVALMDLQQLLELPN
jgi:hypothetical protein